MSNNLAIFFPGQAEFRKWLEEHHKAEKEILVGFYKVGSGKPSMTWSQSVDQAICFGWIDGVRRSIDSESYCIRFTPRRPSGNWSAVNIKKAEELIRNGMMQPAGIEHFKNRKEEKSEVYSYENKPAELPDSLLKTFMENQESWKFFQSQAPGYRKTMFYWILSAKQEGTQISRLKKLIDASALGKKLF
jgi:uncharacterized protein YdeI (YjbR/CyaY-like superfamily)